MDPVFWYPGAKWNIAEWIISFFPTHSTYLEPFFGSGAVFFNKDPSRLETINDMDGSVVNLFKVLRDHSDELARVINLTPWARDEHAVCWESCEEPIEDARRFLVRCWQSHATHYEGKATWGKEIVGGIGSRSPKVWGGVPYRILKIVHRLKDVQIENRHAVELIKRHNDSRILIYADPPYPLSTRRGKLYVHEMTDDDHVQLLNTLDVHPGPVILSGYACDLYDDRLKHWHREIKNTRAEKGQARTEVLWINPVAFEGNKRRLKRLF